MPLNIDLQQILLHVFNFVILYFGLYFILYKPVKNILAQRQQMVDENFEKAKKAEEDALSAKASYEEKLAGAKAEADEILKKANKRAERKSDKIVSGAKAKADDIIRQAQNDARLEKQKAQSEIKHEITEVSTMISEKILEREIKPADHRDFINSFIEKIGENDD